MAAQREHLLVDGYNLIKSSQLFQTPDAPLEQARLALQQTLDAYGRRAGIRITLYYDGVAEADDPAPGRHGDIDIRFSRAPEKADDLIMRAAQDKHGAKWLRVISSDREIRRFAQRHKIRSTASEDFLDELDAPLAPRQSVPSDPEAEARRATADDLDEWERLFSAQPAAPRSSTKDPEDGTEAEPKLDERAVDEWEELFRKGKR